MDKKIDGIILDVDGTLWDSTEIVAGAWTRAVRACGYPDTAVTADMLKGLFGLTMSVIAARLLPQLSQEEQSRVMELCCVYEEEALEADACDICYPGVISTIRELAESVRLFIVSNCQKGYIELFLEKTGLGPCITDTECYGRTGKGKADNIRLVVGRNHLSSPVYVGDTQGDCDAAREAGVPFVWAGYGFGQPDHRDHEIHAFSELLELLCPEGGSGNRSAGQGRGAAVRKGGRT